MGISMLDSRARLDELARLIGGWPGLVSDDPGALVADCLVLVEHLGDARSIVDVGSGGGLPGLPLKIARPDLAVTLVESDQGKAAFLVQACAALGLRGVEILPRRAEEVGRDRRHREAFDAAVARALGPMPVLAELCLPLVRVGGRLLAQKTRAEDVAAGERAVGLLGGRLEGIVDTPSAARARGTVVVVAKVAHTPNAYPRRPGLPAKRPLR
jgi:16S rRNA (guanine527-N7)-methyltransferase